MRKVPNGAWLFCGGSDEAELAAVPESGAAVAILDLEDFTAPAARPAARERAKGLFDAWRKAGITPALRINPLDGEGGRDLEACLPAGPELLLLPKVKEAAEVRALAQAVKDLAGASGRLPGLVPNVETALGLLRAFEIAAACPEVVACLLAAEDLAADLGAERGRDGLELAHARARFLVECRAAAVEAVDCPWTWSDDEGLLEETRVARRLGYRAKSAVKAAHCALIERELTPSEEERARARRIVAAFEAARAAGAGRVELEGTLVELPIYLNAKRLLER